LNKTTKAPAQNRRGFFIPTSALPRGIGILPMIERRSMKTVPNPVRKSA
jgi:hypothetical protein